jgi:hypothetical protein
LLYQKTPQAITTIWKTTNWQPNTHDLHPLLWDKEHIMPEIFLVHYCMMCMFLVFSFIQHHKFVIELHNLGKTTCHLLTKLLAIVYVSNVDPMIHIVWSLYSTIVDVNMYSANGNLFVVSVCEFFSRYHWKFPWCWSYWKLNYQ